MGPVEPNRGVIKKIKESFTHRPKLTLTQRGGAFCALTIVVGFVALNSGNNLIYLVLGMMLALILSSGVLSSINLHRVRLKRRPQLVGRAGAPLGIQLCLVNQKRRWPSMGIGVEDPPVKRVVQDSTDKKGVDASIGARSLYVFRLKGEEEERLQYTLSLPRRGEYLLAGARIYTRFPFGFFEKSIGLRLQITLLITPRVDVDIGQSLDQELKLITSSRASEVELDLQLSSAQSRSEGEQDWSSIDLYRYGQPMRSIHWKASARRGELMSRRGMDSKRDPLSLFVNFQFSADEIKPTEEEEDALMDLVMTVCHRWWALGEEVYLCTPDDERILRSASPEAEAFCLELATLKLEASTTLLRVPENAIALTTKAGLPLIGAHSPRFTPVLSS